MLEFSGACHPYAYAFSCVARGVTRGERGHNYPGASYYGGAESLREGRITAEGAEKFQQCHKYFLQYTTFASEISQVRTWGPNLLLAPGAI